MTNNEIPIIKDQELYKSIIKGSLGSLPLVGNVVVELWNYLDARLIEQRIKTLEIMINQLDIDILEFKDKIINLTNDEHKYYAVRNNIKHLCLSSLPETVDLLNMALIEMILNDQYDMAEYACELIQQFNADDIRFLKRLNHYQKNGSKTCKEEALNNLIEELKNDNKNESTNGPLKTKYKDRNIFYGDNTIFWKDFICTYGLDNIITDAGSLFNIEIEAFEPGDHEKVQTNEWLYIVQSMVKMQKLGVIVCDYKTTLGLSSQMNIDRFHITWFGQKIISYIYINCT